VGTIRCISCSFLIGAVAGVSPFIFLGVLPALLDPSQTLAEPNYKAIAVTGLLIGAACAIMFTKAFDKREPQEIFLYALGVPAILIATVSNLSTKYDAARRVAATQVAARTTILNPAAPLVGDVPLTEVNPPAPPAQGGSLLFPGMGVGRHRSRQRGEPRGLANARAGRRVSGRHRPIFNRSRGSQGAGRTTPSEAQDRGVHPEGTETLSRRFCDLLRDLLGTPAEKTRPRNCIA